MNKGDKVIIDDTSYSRSVMNKKLEHPGNNLRYKKCVIIELNCTFPKTSKWDGDNVNNTIVQVCETGQVIFIEERFLKLVPPKHKIMIDMVCYSGYAMTGKILEISDKLYQEIKRES